MPLLDRIFRYEYPWDQWWSDKTSGYHRFTTEAFLEEEARERLYHLAGGESLLDFGCGSADLLVYLAPHYPRTVGVDFSLSMLAEAEKRLGQWDLKHVSLLHEDDRTVWDAIEESFDRITANLVVQYFTEAQAEAFISAAAKRLKPGGKIVLFDIIDSRPLLLHQLGFFTEGNNPLRIARITWNHYYDILVAKIRGQPANYLGYTHSRSVIERMARNAGLDVEFVHSMYLDFRFHAIMSPSRPPGSTFTGNQDDDDSRDSEPGFAGTEIGHDVDGRPDVIGARLN